MAKRRKNDEYVHPSLRGLPDEPEKVISVSSASANKADIKPDRKTLKAAEAIVAKDMSRPGEMKVTIFMGSVTISIEARVP